MQNTPDLPTANTGTTGGFSGVSGTAGATENLYGTTGTTGGASFGGSDLNRPGTGLGNQTGDQMGRQSQGQQQDQGTVQQAKDQAKGLAGEAKEQTVKMAEQARDHVQELVGRQKDQAADRLGGLAGALREAAHKLQEGEQGGNFGRYADRAAEQVERFSGYLRDNDLRGFVNDTETFARRRPDLFLGGTFFAGLMLARFLKSSASNRSDRGPYSSGYRASTPQSRSSYTPERRNPDQGTYTGAGAGTPSYNAPLGV
ncbi:MAG TPA: hypothetical protein VKK31_10895 [Thermoanaerobaculia bacterium]|nr:hypothetical protein [Thermoanaerobaculia bacterium]